MVEGLVVALLLVNMLLVFIIEGMGRKIHDLKTRLSREEGCSERRLKMIEHLKATRN